MLPVQGIFALKPITDPQSLITKLLMKTNPEVKNVAILNSPNESEVYAEIVSAVLSSNRCLTVIPVENDLIAVEQLNVMENTDLIIIILTSKVTKSLVSSKKESFFM